MSFTKTNGSWGSLCSYRAPGLLVCLPCLGHAETHTGVYSHLKGHVRNLQRWECCIRGLWLVKGSHGSTTRTNPSKQGNSWADDRKASGEPPEFYFQTKVTVPHFLEDGSYASQHFISPSWLPCFGGKSTEAIEFHIQGPHSKSFSKTKFLFIKLGRKGKFWGKWMSLDSPIVSKWPKPRTLYSLFHIETLARHDFNWC